MSQSFNIQTHLNMTLNKLRIVSILISIIVLIIAIPIFANSASNLQQINQQKDNSKPSFISQFNQVLGDCSTMIGGALANCKQTIPMLQQQCSFYDNPTVCNDPRINQIMSSAT